MIEAPARVVDVDGEAARVVAERPTACGGCEAKSGCGTSLLAQWFPQRRLEFRLPNTVGARAGDRVVIGMDANRLQQGAMALYGLPLAGLLVGAVAGERAFAALQLPAELGAVGAGLLGLLAALRLLRTLADRQTARGDGDIRLLRVVDPRAWSQTVSLLPPTHLQTSQGSDKAR